MTTFIADNRYVVGSEVDTARFVAAFSIDRLAGGGLVIANSLSVTVYDADGGQVRALTLPGATYSTVAMLPSGGFVAAWRASSGSDFQFRTQTFDAGGNPTSAATTIAQSTGGQVATLADGSFVAEWTEASASGFVSQFRTVSATNVAQSATASLANSQVADMQAIGDGRVLVLYKDVGSNGDSNRFAARIYDPVAGTLTSTDLFSIQPAGGNYESAELTRLASGNFLVTWSEIGGYSSIHGQVYSAAGVAQAQSFLIDHARSSAVSALDDGGFVVTYNSDAPVTLGPKDQIAQTFDDNAIPTGNAFFVEHSSSAANGAIITGFGTNDIAVAYSLSSGSLAGPSVLKLLYNTIPGTSAGETLNGTTAGDIIAGFDGDDTLNGLDGDDRLLGGAGADVLNGGNGSDTAVYDDSSAGVTVNLGVNAASGGTAAGDTFVSIENIVGSAFDDVLTGDNGQNRIDGGAGNDTLAGAGGADVLTGGSGADVFRGAAEELSGDTITDFGTSDTILITNRTLAGFTYSYNAGVLTYSGGSLTLANQPAGKLVAISAGPGAVSLSLKLATATPPARDFTGDGKSDLLWRSVTGQVSNWVANSGLGFNDNSANSSRAVGLDWQIARTADFDGDGKADILWRHASGAITTWLASSTGSGFLIDNPAASLPMGLDWTIAGAGDFNGDGRADILWRNDNGALIYWTSNGNGFGASVGTRNVSLDWHIAATGDFNGDGKDDILWRNDTGAVTTWLGDAALFTDNPASSRQVSLDWHIAGVGDFNGDGKDDILWRNDSGMLTDWLSTGASFADNSNATRLVPLDWRVQGTGDYNGDGKDDLLWRNADGTITDWLSNGNGFSDNPNASQQVGLQMQLATNSVGRALPFFASADFNGDGKDDLLWRNANGTVTDWLSNGAGFADNLNVYRVIGPDWRIVGTGDFNGDGRSDILWRNADGTVTDWLSNGTSFTDNGSLNRVVPADWHVEATGDFNGDGKDDILWRNANGTVTDWLSNGTGFVDNGSLNRVVPAAWQIAATGDFNGDGRADILWRNADGTVTDWLSNGTGFVDNGALSRVVPADWDIVATGDFNGDGKDDILWRNADGTVTDWLADASPNSSGFSDNASFYRAVSLNWQVTGIGDFNGDGRDDIAWRNADGMVTDWLSNGVSFTDNSAATRAVPLEWAVQHDGLQLLI
jgi:Ca2+-binding RTX toxin-like protein